MRRGKFGNLDIDGRIIYKCILQKNGLQLIHLALDKVTWQAYANSEPSSFIRATHFDRLTDYRCLYVVKNEQ
jgi:hypothetical protein